MRDRDVSKRKKLKGIPGYFEFSVKPESSSYPSLCKVLDPSLEPIIGYNINEVQYPPIQRYLRIFFDEETYIAREIQSFSNKPDLIPYSAYVNNLYICPELV